MKAVVISLPRVLSAAALLAAGAWLDAAAEALPRPGPVDSRMRTVAYDAEQVYRLHAFVGYHIELVFEEGELFQGQGGGDLDGVAIGAHENHLILKPRAQDVGTNLVIYTNRRAYRFDYRVHSHPPDPLADEVMYAVRFTYPTNLEPANAVHAEQSRIVQGLEQGTAARPRNHDYWYCGDKALMPTGAFDDGVHTTLTFGSRAEVPALFVLNDDGAESLLNYSMQDGRMVIHRVARRLIVRRGGLTGCIVNKGYQGSGERMESGTLSPQVSRKRKESRP